jgi:cytochrome c biogenesis protein CcmG/thiol:disulfide interchange protein DsbE
MTVKTKTTAAKAKTSRAKTAKAKMSKAKTSRAKTAKAMTRKVTKPTATKAKATRTKATKAKSKTTKRTEKLAPSRWGVALPFLIFAGLACLFWYALQTGDPSRLPSALIGRSVPEFTLPPLEGLKTEDGAAMPSFDAADLATGQATIVNVFASWCVPCLVEHPLLMTLAKENGVRLYGINYKDAPASARGFLGRYGNPYSRAGADASGRTAIEFGVYGVPETYVISGDGKIVYRHVGPLTEEAIATKLLPLVQQSKSAQ